MTYTEHQQEKFAREMAAKWHRVKTVTSPFVSVIILDTLILLGALAGGPFLPLVMKYCILSVVAAGVGLLYMDMFLTCFYWRCPACG